MKNELKPKTSDGILNKKAEELYSKKITGEGKTQNLISEAEAKKLIHEFEVHQIELEMRNQELRAAKEKLKLTSEKYTQLYDFAPCGCMTLSNKAEIIGINLVGAKMLGKERSRIMNSSFGFFLSKHSKPVFNQFLEKIFLSRKLEICDVQLNNHHDKPMHVHLSGIAGDDANQCNIILVDISDRIFAEKALAHSEQLHRIIMESIHDPVFITDNEGEYTFIYSNVKFSLGYAKNEIAETKNIKKLIGENTFNDVKLKSARGPTNIEKSILSKRGDTLHYNISISKVAIQDGKLLFVFHDITEQKKTLEFQKAQIRLVDYAANHSIQDLLQKFLDEVEILTQSEIGFYHFVEEYQLTISLQTWSSNTLNGFCKLPDQEQRHYPISQAGIWVECVSKLKPVIHNDYQNAIGKKGLPDGHVPVIRELVVPVIRNGKVLAILGVGNKKTKYNQSDVKVVQQLADVAWKIIIRKRAQKEQFESEAKFRSLFDQSPVGMVIVGFDKRFVKANFAFCKFLGYQKNEIIGNSIANITHPDDVDIGMMELKQLLKDELESFQVQKRYLRKDGKIMWGETTVRLVRDETGKPLYFLPVIQDITERKAAEERLRMKEEKYRTLFENMSQGVFYQLANGVITDANDAALQMFGLNYDELIGKTSHDPTWIVVDETGEKLPPDQHPSMKAFNTGKPCRNEIIGLYNQVNESYRWVIVNAIPQFITREMKPCQVFVSMHEITDRVRTTEALRNSESHARALIDAIPDMMFRIDKKGEFIDYEASQDQLYYKDDIIIGKNCLEILPPELAAITLENIGLAIKSGQMQVYEYQLTISGDAPSEFEARMVPASSNDVVVIVRDVTEERKNAREILNVNQKLREANAEKDKFFSIIAHDLKSPFNVFLGATELIKSEFNVLSADQILSLIGSLHGSAKKLYELLENLLEWSRMQRGVFSFEPKEIHLHEFITETQELMLEMAANKNIIFKINVPKGIKIFADTKMLNSLLRNLISNAVKFTQSGGRIIIAAQKISNNLIEISVIDNGIGMPPETMQNLFSLTENTNRPGTEGEPSVGLGLLLCNEFAKWHGSEIYVESEEGKGSRFSFRVSQNDHSKN